MGFIDWLFNIEKDDRKEKVRREPRVYQELCRLPPIMVDETSQTLKKPKKRSLGGARSGTKRLDFKDYIGQTKVKNIMLSYLDSKYEVLPHILIHGAAGHGKTTLARIIADKKGVKFTEVMAQSIKDGNHLVQLIKDSGGGILFVDEVHGLNRNIVEIIYSMLEDFKCNGEDIEPFTFIGATTEYGELLRDRRPFVDRFKINLELVPYSLEEMEQLIQNYVKRKNYNIGDNGGEIIAKNCRLVPRIGIRLADAAHNFHSDVNKAIYSYNIVKDGLTDKDIKVLRYLKKNNKAGIQSISAYLNTQIQSYRYEIEPYLLQKGYIMIVPGGRQITDDGRNFIKLLDKTQIV